MTGEKAPSTMRSLERSIDVLEVLESAGRPLRLAEVASLTDLHIATAQRILSVLESRNRVERDEFGYRAGVNLIFGANAYLTTSPLVAAARPVLQELAERTGLTASLFVRTGWHRAVVARVDGTRPIHYQLPIGARLPLHLGAGKTLAASMSAEEFAAFVASADLSSDATGNPVQPEALRADLEVIRQQGFQVARNERQIGSMSISAPVRRLKDRETVGAVTIGAAVEDVSQSDVENLSIEVRRAAAAIRVP
ncbi:IclR family transcriptional regulator [Pseudonocardia sp. ICBG601]|uniref:IclR family transcriptional regulator n=1 Tax=Pseudonocardia sp. ICBG601 TaxID=2846759 RepID=UPI001CF60F3B|nr:IclR family transcriptional regulator [Pseudonocardia sp. ICBG601]